jgi:Protein of unknown function (DUF3987)
VVLDSDCGHTLDEIAAAVRQAAFEAVIHSTHSHLTDRAEVSLASLDKHNGDAELVMRGKRFLPRLVSGCRKIGETPDGKRAIIEHQPCPKYRIILPLLDPWRVSDYGSKNAADEAWRSFVRELSAQLGLQTDQSCVDPSRLFYFPRTRPGGPLYEFRHIHGAPVDIHAITGVTPPPLRQDHPRSAWLLRWAATHASRFEIVTALQARSPAVLHRLNGAKQALECPFEHEHSTPGGSGTFAVNASQLASAGLPGIDTGFVLKCSHNACAGRDRLALLSGMLTQGWLAESDLTDPEFLSAGPGSAASQPLPLFPPLAEAEPYPVDALGVTLARAAKAIASKAQVPIAMAAQSVLAVASLAASSHADIQLPFGQPRPLSLFFATVAASGDRKSTADNEALWPVSTREKNLREAHADKLKEWRIDFAAWAAEKRKIEGDRRSDFDDRKARLSLLGPEPEKLLSPFLVSGDLTVEGLTKNWSSAHAALGVFTAEGGMFTAGHGMNDDNRLKTAAMLPELWDEKPVKRVRALDGVTILPGRRLSLHVMIQPKAAAGFLCNDLLRDQGLLSRILVVAPASLAGSRAYREPCPQAAATIIAYGARLLSILKAEPALEPGTRNELAPTALPISASATAIWRQFYDHIEGQCGAGNGLEAIGDFAAKAAEHAARIAGVITIIEDLRAREIGLSEMQGAVVLAEWYVCEALRLKQAGRTDPKLLGAAKLLEWLQGQPGGMAGISAILTHGPNALRTKAAAEEALAILAAHGWTVEVSNRPRIIKAVGGRSGESLSVIQSSRIGWPSC